MFKFSPRWTLPGLTSPPTRMRVPGAICFSAISVGELKNTIESLIALSTSTAAIANTPRLEPIRIRRRCLRVITYRSCSPFEPQAFDHVVDLAKLVGIAGQRPLGIGGGGLRLVALAQHPIGAQQAVPSLDVVAVLLETIGQPRDHAADHVLLLIGCQFRRGRGIGRAWPRCVGLGA